MEKLIQDEAHIYAKWASGHHKAAVQNQEVAMWAAGLMSSGRASELQRRNLLRHRIHLVPIVAGALCARDIRSLDSLKGMRVNVQVVRVTQ